MYKRVIIIIFSSDAIRFMNHRSSDLLQTEEPFNLSECRSSSDSNKPSSGEVSPYDNNSPVMSERRAELGSPDGEQPFRVPGQYSLVGQVAGWNRESGAESWGSKGELFTQKLTVKVLLPCLEVTWEMSRFL